MTISITAELIRAALLYIPPNQPRDEWARVAMAIKSEFPDDIGRDLFTDWSATADGFDAKATATTWRSVKAGGGVRINTLLFLAKSHGFELPKGNQAASKPSPDAIVLQKRQQAERQQAEQAQLDATHTQAAAEALALWSAASDTGHSEYLQRKGVQAHGVRFAAAGWLLVPVRDTEGTLWNVQRVAPRKPADGGPDKLFQKGGRKSGLWHLLGAADAASAAPAVLLVAEGYATAASLHEATGYPCAVAFDAGNLAAVSKALRHRYPAALLVLCGDDDVQTYALKGINPGRDKATAAARAVRGLAVFPAPLPEGGSDFNDLHQAQGLEVVRGVVQSAIDMHQAAIQPTSSKPKAPPRMQRNTDNTATPGDAEAAAVKVFDRFHSDESGLWFAPPGDDGNATHKRICGPLRVLGLARDNKNNQAALLLEFDSELGRSRRWLMPMAMLSGDGTSYRTALLGMGFMTPRDAARRGWLTDYLQTRKNLPLMRHVSKVGWHGSGVNTCYVLPHETMGNPDGEPVIFYSDTGIEANFNQRGSLAQWQQSLGALCVGNSRLAFAVSVAFAGPLLAWAPGTSGGGFHYVGGTSTGKTTGLLVAASIWGKGSEKDSESYMQKWRATDNGLEGVAEQHSDCVLILDELGQMDANKAGEAAYMLADGMGKVRGKAAGGNRPKATWRVLSLSSGELSLAQHMDSVGKKIKGGQEVRLIPIPAEITQGTTLEDLHGFAGGHELSNHVQTHAARQYGTAGRAWLEWLVASIATLRPRLDALMASIEPQLVPPGAEGQVFRAVKRFTLCAAAGELATQEGFTGWPEGEATRAAQSCLNAWLQSRGGPRNSEQGAMLRQARMFFEAHGEGRFTWFHRGADDHNSKTLHRAGFRMLLDEDGVSIKTNNEHGHKYGDTMPASLGTDTSCEYYVLPEVFKAEVCKGFDPAVVCRVLVEQGCLHAPEPGRFSTTARLPGMGKVRCYRVKASIFELDV
ncbi:DUF927 domain-containing protein [Rhodoferax sp.]|uniref:DUF927 domain-containing protein n=1 Tax=Rhodoferax sp. TaxID=50421 RepID=UPI00374CE0A3